MKLGLFLALFGKLSLEQALDKAKAAGVQMVEIGVAHIAMDEWLDHPPAQTKIKDMLASRGLSISAFSPHGAEYGNPLHPNPDIAKVSDAYFRKVIRLAQQMGVPVVNNFSGCPGGSPQDVTPNWITCAWPDDFPSALQWQWEERVIPYWRTMNQFLTDHGVQVAIEQHPGFVVYNTSTMLRLRAECGAAIGTNFDPSHLFWQGIDPVQQVYALKGAIFHMHAKDTMVQHHNIALNGVLDAGSYANLESRAWFFRTIGYGQPEIVWKNIASALRITGYDYVMSIEHEDALMSVDEGLSKAASFLKSVILTEQPAQAWWI
jgi:sugar phosphate isomerase/epimerase